MTRSYGYYLFLLLSLSFGVAGAQSIPTDTPAAESGPSGSQTSPEVVLVPERSMDARPTDYAPSLNETGLIPLDHSVRSRFLVGAAYSGGYDTRPEEISGAPGSGISVISPFAGLQINRENVQYVFQYLPTITRYTDSHYDGGSLHTATAKLTGNVSERWDWEVRGIGMHGLDSVRLVAPEPTVPVGDVPGVGPAAASYRSDAGTTTYLDVDGRLSYHLSERDAISGTVSNSYGTSTSSIGDSIVAGFKAAYSHDMSPTRQWAGYGQVARYYGALHCYGYGGGAALTWRPGEHSFLQIGGGPEVLSPACGKQQNFAYRVGYSARLTERSQVYLLSARETAGIYIGPGLWEQSLTAGYQRELSRLDTVSVSGGYVKETLYGDLRAYSGIYGAAAYSHKLPGSLSAACTYRYFDGGWSGSRFNRNTLLLSLTWLPTGGRMFQ